MPEKEKPEKEKEKEEGKRGLTIKDCLPHFSFLQYQEKLKNRKGSGDPCPWCGIDLEGSSLCPCGFGEEVH